MQSLLTQTFQINSGATASSQFSVGAAGRMVCIAPGLTSTQLFFEAAVASGGPYTRLHKTDGSSSFIWAVGPGSAAIAIDPLIVPTPFGRVVASVAQTAPASFTLVTRR